MDKRYLEIITQHPTAWLDHRDFAINLVKTIQPKIILDILHFVGLIVILERYME